MNRTKGHVSKALDERSLVELLGVIRSGVTDKIQLNSALMQLHERLSIPFACLALGIFAFPLGVQSTALRRSSGFGMGIFFFLVYYFLLAIGWSAGETGKYPPVLGMWLPNLVMGGVGVFFLVRNAGEKPVLLPGFIGKAGRAVQNLLKRNV
jgi:lipopolysaccharide export system permease protein